jgi:hypothetical protein
MKTIYDIAINAEKNLSSGQPVKLGKYTTHDHAEVLATTQAYLNSQHISGKLDSKNREKPFHNIVTQAVNVWYKATDVDRKDIKIKPTKAGNRVKSFIATILFRDWMREHNFGQFLNKWGYTLSAYGSAVSKFVEQDGKLVPSIIDWDRLICDPIDFYSNPVIEKIYYTPAQLRALPYDQEEVERVIEANEKSGETRETFENQPSDNRAEYIGVYEIHGELPLWYLTYKEGDETIYRQQMHVVFIKKGKNEEDDIETTLYSGKEKQNPYFISHLIEQDGRTLSIGAVEYLFDSQWMVNYSVKLIKDQLDIASKLVSQTSDTDFAGRNVINEMDVGDILVTKENQPIVPVNLQASSFPYLSNFVEIWKQGGRGITGVNESVTGETMPSGTPYRLGAMLNTESHTLFEMMRENKGLYLEDMIRQYVLPFFKKSLKKTDEIVVTLEGEELEKFDELSMPLRLEQELRQALMAGKMPSMQELETMVDEGNHTMGNLRGMKLSTKKTWVDYFSDLDMNAVEVDITGEQLNKAEFYSAVNAVLQMLMSNPNALQDPNIKKLLDKILDEAGMVSPLELVKPNPIGMGQATGGAVGTVGAVTDGTAGLPEMGQRPEVGVASN